MDCSKFVLKNEEKAELCLRQLYRNYGYTQYNMSKFEEYDLYVRNKSFLVSDRVITFTNTDGKLMALKPDVTLSIVKNTNNSDSGLHKLYYNENVYRVSESSGEFKEIMQVGLECIGDIDLYALSEVIILAAKSLALISEKYVLDISHMGVIAGFLDDAEINEENREKIFHFIGEKNTHELQKVCIESHITEEISQKLVEIASIYGPISEEIEHLQDLSIGPKTNEAVTQLREICQVMKGLNFSEHMYLDFSIVNDMSYYNGIVFSGAIDGIPVNILSGGQYDNLLHKMGKDVGAVGFAVYLDCLERFNVQPSLYDVDVLLLYDDEADAATVIHVVQKFVDEGKQVRAQKGEKIGLRYKQLAVLREGEVEIFETNG